MSTPLVDLFDLSGRSAIVTGGATGIGRQMAEALAEAGADVALCARDGERCVAAAEEIGGRWDVRALGLTCDVRDQDQVQAVVERTVEAHGRIDVLVNNSGTTWAAAPEDVPLEGWQKVLDVNLTGLFAFCQAAGRVMLEQGSGKIVNIASIMAFRGAPPEQIDAIAYHASKGGVLTLTKDLACKWAAHGVSVNGIAPGWFPSIMSDRVLAERGEALLRQIPLGRFGGDSDLKGAVVFLSSPASAFVTGHTLVVDGGQLAR